MSTIKHQYTPRRANRKRWLEGSPEYILDCLDNTLHLVTMYYGAKLWA